MYIFSVSIVFVLSGYFFFQAEDGIRDLVRSRGLGDVYKRQLLPHGELDRAFCALKGNPVPGTRLGRQLSGLLRLSLIHI